MTVEREMVPMAPEPPSELTVLPQPRSGDEALARQQKIIDYTALGSTIVGSATIWGANTPNGLPVTGCLPHYLNLASRHTLPN